MFWCPTLPKQDGKGSISEALDIHARDLQLNVNNPTRRALASDEKRDKQKYLCSCFALAHLHFIDASVQLPPTK